MAPMLWADLPLDLLVDISGCLHDAVDFTCFHAVCTAWRDALPTSRRSPEFLPCLLVPSSCNGHILHSSVNLFPKRTKRRPSYYRRSCHDILLAKPPGASPAGRNWVASANGTATWLLMTTDTGAGLLDLITGALTTLPAYHDKMRQMENPHGIVYTDGTVFLYNFAQESGRIAFTAAVLRPGDVAWTPVKTMLDYMPSMRTNACHVAAYHDGKILVCADLDYWCILTSDDDGISRELELSSMWCGKHRCRIQSYALEFQGQLHWVSVMIRLTEIDPCRIVYLVVHAWEEDKMQWVARDGRSLSDHVLFLSPRASFAVDALELGMDGACAYLVFRQNANVLRYNFIDGNVKLVERIDHQEWPAANEAQNMYWFKPKPAISPVQEIRKRVSANYSF